MDRPPACYFASVQDGKQEIYLEWPYVNVKDNHPAGYSYINWVVILLERTPEHHYPRTFVYSMR